MPDTKTHAALLADPELHEAQRRAMFAYSREGVAFVALDGAFLDANPAFCRVTGYTVGELRRLTFGDITHPADVDADRGELERLRAGEIDDYAMAKRYIPKVGPPVWINLQVYRIEKSDTLVHYIGFVMPVTLGDAYTKVEKTPGGAVLRPFLPLGQLLRDNWKVVSTAGVMAFGTLGTLTANYFRMTAKLEQQQQVIDANKAHVAGVEQDVSRIKKKAAKGDE